MTPFSTSVIYILDPLLNNAILYNSEAILISIFQKIDPKIPKIQKIIKKNLQEFEGNLARNSKVNPKSVYSYINSKTATKESIKALYLYNETSNDTQSLRKSTTDGAVIAG